MQNNDNNMFSNVRPYYRRMHSNFKADFPDLAVRGSTYSPNGPCEITVDIPHRGILVYTPFGVKETRIRWINGPYEDERIIKEREREMRSDMYQDFLREIEWYQRMTGASQGDIARISGVSRKSINKYLSGIVAPKVSTMRKICKALEIDI